MEDIQFTSPEDVPLPPENVKILDFTAEPYPDGKRVQLAITFTPFQANPSGEIIIQDPEGKQAAFLTIIETMDVKTEITLHLRGNPVKGRYTAEFRGFYLREETSDQDPDRIQGLIQEPIGQQTAQFILP